MRDIKLQGRYFQWLNSLLGPESDVNSLSGKGMWVENLQILKLQVDSTTWSLAAFSAESLSSEKLLKLALILFVVTWKTLSKIQVLSCSPSVKHGAKEILVWVGRNSLVSKICKHVIQLNYHWMSLQLFRNSASMTKTSGIQTMKWLNGLFTFYRFKCTVKI